MFFCLFTGGIIVYRTQTPNPWDTGDNERLAQGLVWCLFVNELHTESPREQAEIIYPCPPAVVHISTETV